jgi:hypothetical protein
VLVVVLLLLLLPPGWLRAAARVRCRTVAMPLSLTACFMLLLLLLLLLPLGWLRVVARVRCGIVALLLIINCCCHVAAAAAAARLVEGRSSCALWHAWGMTESRLGDPSAVRYLFKRALQANPRSRYTHLAWALWERRQVRWHGGGVGGGGCCLDNVTQRGRLSCRGWAGCVC